MTKHYRKSPSKLERAKECPGSLTIAEPERSSNDEAAREGTRLHDLAHYCIEANGNPEAVAVPLEDWKVIGPYVNYVLTLLQLCAQWFAELTLQSETDPDFGGTADFFGYWPKAKTGFIVDLKTGRIPKPAEWNDQLLAYAALWLEQYPEIEKWELTIVQPATPGPAVDTWETTSQVVRDWRRNTMERLECEEFHAGHWCRYCPHAPTCDALYQANLKVAQEDFDDGDDVTPDQQRERWLRVLSMEDAFAAAVKGARDGLRDLIKKGEDVPGLKLVKSWHNRSYVYDEETTIKKLQRRGVGKKVSTVAKLKTPAQLEKVAPADKLDGLVERKEKGLALVPARDSREAVTFPSAADDFDDV